MIKLTDFCNQCVREDTDGTCKYREVCNNFLKNNNYTMRKRQEIRDMLNRKYGIKSTKECF